MTDERIDEGTHDFPGKVHVLPRPKGPRPAPATQPPTPVENVRGQLSVALREVVHRSICRCGHNLLDHSILTNRDVCMGKADCPCEWYVEPGDAP